MCGICGTYSYRDGGSIDTAAQRAVRDHMSTRGPDGHGEWQSELGDVWLGHRRLAIIDPTPAGAQPMASSDGRHVVAFNGEIYNYAELRAELISEGYEFRGTSDTEVLLQLYRRWGPDCVLRLRGMFAFVLWDTASRTLFCARDPYGIKPFYYADTGRAFAFASQVKALLFNPSIPRTLDPAGVAGFFVFGSVPEPWTVYSAIKSLPAGSTLIVDHNGVHSPSRYHSIGAVIRDAEQESARIDGQNAPRIFRQALLDSVRNHIVADVPVGAFLSGGIDSGAVVGLMRDAGQSDIRTVTLAFAEYESGPFNEAPLSCETARRYETRHATRLVTAEEFAEDLPKIMQAMDQPSIDGINTWFVAKAAHEQGLKVAVSGIGGDELLGGYGSFTKLPFLLRLTQLAGASKIISRILLSGVDAIRGVGLDMHPKWGGLVRYGSDMAGAYLLQRGLFLPDEVGAALADEAFLREGLEALDPPRHLAEALHDGPQTAFGQIATLESCFYLRNQLLRDADWAGMAHSVEIRTPLVDHVLLPTIAAIMTSNARPSGKSLLALAPSVALPSDVVNRHKTGFAIPVEAWLADKTAKHEGRRPLRRIFSRDWARSVASMQNLLPLAHGTTISAAPA